MSSAYLKLLIFLPAILIPAYASSSPAFLMMYSAYKFNKQGDNIQPWCTPFPFWNQSVVPCLVLTVSSWPGYRFLRRQVRWSGISISWRIFCSHIICKYLLPFSRTFFYCWWDFFFLCKNFKFGPIYFCFCFLCSSRQIQKYIATIYVEVFCLCFLLGVL